MQNTTSLGAGIDQLTSNNYMIWIVWFETRKKQKLKLNCCTSL